MSTLTIRQIPFAVERAIKERSSREHISLNKAVVGILEEAITGSKKAPPRRYHDLDWMCGMWNKKQSDNFQKHLENIRTIDQELWQ